MLNRISLAAAACALVTAFSIAACGGGGNDKTTPTSAGQSPAATTTAATGGTADACKLMTADDAAAALGGVTDIQQASPSNTAANGVSVSNCSYFAKEGVASLLARKSSAGDAATQFDTAKKAATGAMDVAGVGEKAFYNPQIGQLNVLVKDTWLIVSAGEIGKPAPAPSQPLIDAAKKAAERV